MKTALILLVAAAATAPGLKPPAEEEADAALMPAGSSFTCTNPSGCIVTTPEALNAALRETHAQGASACRRTL